MRNSTAYMLDLYYQNQVDHHLRWGDWQAFDALFKLPVERLKDEQLRLLAKMIFDPKRYLNKQLKEIRRPEKKSDATRRFYRCKDKQHWQSGGAAERGRLTLKFNSLEQEVHLAFVRAFSVLEEWSDSSIGLKWCGYAGMECTAEQSVLGRTITTQTVCEPRFRTMHDNGVSPVHPEQSWTPVTLLSEAESRKQSPQAARLLGAVDFASPCGIGNGLKRLAILIRTDLVSSLKFGDDRHIHDSSMQGHAIGDLYDLITLIQFRNHLVHATASLGSYFTKLSMLEIETSSRAIKKRIAKKVQSSYGQLKVLKRHLPEVMKITDSAFSAIARSKMTQTESVNQIHEQIERCEGSLQTDIEKVLCQLRENGTEGLRWNEPTLICEVRFQLPEAYINSGAEPLSLRIDLKWPLIALNDFTAKPSEAIGRKGQLASVLQEQGLPMWAWPFITEISVRVEMSAVMSIENPTGWLPASRLPA